LHRSRDGVNATFYTNFYILASMESILHVLGVGGLTAALCVDAAWARQTNESTSGHEYYSVKGPSGPLCVVILLLSLSRKYILYKP
jgi:hypothetical protein